LAPARQLEHSRIMRVCVVPHKYPPDFGGVAVASQRYAQGLAAAGHQVLVVSLDPRLAPTKLQRSTLDGVECLRVGVARRTDDTSSAWFDAIVAEHRRRPFDIVVGRYLGHAAFVAVLAARFLELPSVVSARGNDLDRGVFDSAAFGQLLWSVQSASAVTAVSRELSQKLTALAPDSRPVLAPNGVDSELFCPGAPASTTGRVVLFVGEARKKKGLPVLLEAFSQCARAKPEATLVLVGGVRSEDASLLEFFSSKHRHARVSVVAALPQAELVSHYRSASVFVMPSLHDGLPNALLEAMACGCPIVASSVGGILDAVRDGVEGRLVPAADSEALANALLDLLSRPQAALELGQAARRRARSDFSLASERQRDVALLESLVTGR
jgi:glycosyltransferase involved in cell wall biosynthesis